MQVVAAEFCASLIFPGADALAANPMIDNAEKNRMVSPRMNTPPLLFPLTRNIQDSRASASLPLASRVDAHTSRLSLRSSFFGRSSGSRALSAAYYLIEVSFGGNEMMSENGMDRPCSRP
jgi:hypothetical protein